MADNQARNFIITINNPFYYSTDTSDDIEEELLSIDLDSNINEFGYLPSYDEDYLHYQLPYTNCEEFYKYLSDLEHVKYFIFQLEKGEIGKNVHIQLYIEFSIAKRFSTIKNYFPTAHIEKRLGTKVQARDYCSKKETRISSKFYEFGNFAEERSRTDIKNVVELIKSGASDLEILDLYPTQFLRMGKMVQDIRQLAFIEKTKGTFNKRKVIYIWGTPGCGKTSYLINKYGKDACRVFKYKNPFDHYNDEKVLILDEFYDSLDFDLLLNICDGYQISLPCRFRDKVGLFDTVYIVSNVPLSEQYKSIQENKKVKFKALMRRIDEEINFDEFKCKQLCIAPILDEEEIKIVDEIF